MTQDHKKLEAFTIADELALEVYRASASMPMSERFGLQSQLRSAALRVPVQIVAGCARRSTQEYVNLLTLALDASVELRYLLGLATRLEVISAHDIKLLDHQCQALIRALTRLIESDPKPARNVRPRGQSMKLKAPKTPSLKPKP